MFVLIAIAFLIAGGFSLIIVRVSVSCMFWASKYRFDKMHVFKIFFPYYIISLFTLCVIGIIGFDYSIYAVFYFGAVFITSLLIWRYEIKKSGKAQHLNNEIIEPQHPELP